MNSNSNLNANVITVVAVGNNSSDHTSDGNSSNNVNNSTQNDSIFRSSAGYTTVRTVRLSTWCAGVCVCV